MENADGEESPSGADDSGICEQVSDSAGRHAALDFDKVLVIVAAIRTKVPVITKSDARSKHQQREDGDAAEQTPQCAPAIFSQGNSPPLCPRVSSFDSRDSFQARALRPDDLQIFSSVPELHHFPATFVLLRPR